MNIATNLEWSAFFFPDRPVISEGDSVTCYARLNRQANRVATALIKLKVQPGDHIGIFAPNSGDWIAFYFGVLKAGAVPVTLSSQLSKDELVLLLNHCRPKMIFTSSEKLDRLKERLGNVRYCFSAAASMATDTVRQWKAQTGLAIYEGYGMTEASPVVTYNHYYRHVIGSVGTAAPGVEIQIRDQNGHTVGQGREGEICVRGRNIMRGYLNNPEGTRAAFWEDGWFRSGDIGRFDSDGYLYIVDRLKDLIITGGENVYPKEVD